MTDQIIGPRRLKTCSQCGVIKPANLGNFYRRSKSLDGLQSQCRVCHKYRAIQRHYAHREEIKARMRNRYHANRSACIELAHHNRDAAGFFSWDACLDIYQHRCALCGEKEGLTVDHITPVCRGGSNWQFNIQPLCAPCNRAKHTRSHEEMIHVG